MEKRKDSAEALCQQGMQLSMGLIIGNGLLCPLIIPNRGIIDGFAIGGIAALICLGVYSYRASRLAKRSEPTSAAPDKEIPSTITEAS